MSHEWPFSLTGNGFTSSLKVSRAVLRPLTFGLARFWTSWLNKSTVYNSHVLQKKLDDRRLVKHKRQVPLLTISNHQSCLDDPLLWTVSLKWKQLLQHLRWVPGAAELCCPNPLFSFLCGSAQIIPVERGKGVYQRGMDFVLEKLNDREWIHVFPEGKVNVDNIRRLKWGIGRLLSECHSVPDIIPMWLIGMDDILPNKRPYFPRVGKRVSVYIGEPLNLTEKIQELRSTVEDPGLLRRKITNLVEIEFWKVKELAEELHFGYSESSLSA